MLIDLGCLLNLVAFFVTVVSSLDGRHELDEHDDDLNEFKGAPD